MDTLYSFSCGAGKEKRNSSICPLTALTRKWAERAPGTRPFRHSSIRITPYTTLASVPKTMTGPATTNIFDAMPVMSPSGCVKIDIQFFRNFFSCLQSGGRLLF